jgi:hypothetical protein
MWAACTCGVHTPTHVRCRATHHTAPAYLHRSALFLPSDISSTDLVLFHLGALFFFALFKCLPCPQRKHTSIDGAAVRTCASQLASSPRTHSHTNTETSSTAAAGAKGSWANKHVCSSFPLLNTAYYYTCFYLSQFRICHHRLCVCVCELPVPLLPRCSICSAFVPAYLLRGGVCA